MKDEIKEILEDVKRHLDYVEATKQMSIRDNEIKSMYDYITKLQEEYKKTNIQANYFMNRSDDLEEIIDDYKSRIDKVVEYIENDLKSFLYSIEYKTLLNILNGGDE